MSFDPLNQGKIAVRASFEEIAQLVAQAVNSVLPARFKFIVIMVAPDNDVKMLHNLRDAGEAQDIVRFVHEGGKKRVFRQGA